MKLNTNFRRTQLTRVRMIIAFMYASAISIVLAVGVILSMNRSDAADAAILEAQVRELRIERDAQAAVYQGLGVTLDEDNGIRTGWLSLFGKYQGGSPEALLYDIEKFTPQNLYLTNFTYDRLSGVATVNAVANRNGEISSMLEALEGTGKYHKVLLVNKTDSGKKDNFRIVVRIEQKNSSVADE